MNIVVFESIVNPVISCRAHNQLKRPWYSISRGATCPSELPKYSARTAIVPASVQRMTQRPNATSSASRSYSKASRSTCNN